MKPKNTAKKKTLTTVLVILVLFGSLGAILYFSGMLFFTGIAPCHPPFWVAVDGVATQKVLAFYDDNQNGIYEQDQERTLPNITVQMAGESAITNKQGLATVYAFKAGCPCKCSQGDTLTVLVPDGWQSSTPLQYKLTGKEGTISLGFYR
jgi:hypothetical protein